MKEKIEWEFRAIISRNQKGALRLQKSATVIGQLKFRDISGDIESVNNDRKKSTRSAYEWASNLNVPL